jgi:hypothetical protein
LFSSGVGYFQREGDITGSTRVDLSFPVQDINDLIKSMVLQDLGGGHVSAVSYDSQAPVEKTLRSFAINLTGNPTFSGILNQARGEKVEAILQQTNVTQPANLTGVILGVETQRQPAGQQVVETEFLNMWCAEGMRSVKLGEVQRIRFLNPVVDSEVKKALETLALSHDTQKKAVSINFSGDGKRAVRVGYVVENPIWKTSYRLVLNNKEGSKPFLQGWAVVENTQDEDWNHVRMSLVSGRPISFQMNLYDPLFVSRPVVEPELFASLRPPTYSGAMEKAAEYKAAGAPAAPPLPTAGLAGLGDQQARQRAANLANRALDARKELQDGRSVLTIDPTSGVANAAVTTELGDFFQYLIEQPVSLPRQKSALLPIVNQDVDATKVSIYNQAVHAKFPLHGLKFKNNTSLHLMQGPITVFENGSYAGDARILDLQPKEERLISYAIDLGTEVEPVVVNPTDRIINVKVNRGVIHATHKVREAKTYNIKNRSEHDRLVVVEHPYRQQFSLITPEKFSERARDVYRFEVKVAAGQSGKQEVVEERDVVETVAISNANDNTIRIFTSNAVTSQAVKDALAKSGEFKAQLATIQRDLAHANKQLADINADQQRLRANLREVPPTSNAYKRYLEKFDLQETEIEQLRESIKQFQNKELTQRQAFDQYLGNLTVE